MLISKVTIHNYRSIEHAELTLRGLSLLIGRNNTGKSNIIEAIRLFFGDVAASPSLFREGPAGPVGELYVELEYRGDSAEEVEDLPEKYRLPENRFRVRCSLSRDKKPVHRGYVVDGNGKEVEDPDAKYFGAVGKGKLGAAIHIPAVRYVQDETKGSGPSAVGRLLKEVVSEGLAESDAYSAYDRAIKGLEDQIRGFDSSKDGADRSYTSVADVEATLREELEVWRCVPTIRLAPLDPLKLASSSVEVIVTEEDGREILPTEAGQGFQRALVRALIKAWAEVMRAREVQKLQRAQGDMKKLWRPPARILLYEEPEAYLALPQQRILFGDLRTLSDGGTQVLATTHSPVFLEDTVDDFSSLNVVQRQVWTGVRTVGEELNAKLDDPEFRRTFRFHCWLNAERNAAFFSERVVLVEGATDKAVFLWLLSKHRDRFKNMAITIFDCGFKGQMPHFMQLFGDFGIEHTVVYDDDHSKVSNKIDHKELNALIEQAKNRSTVATISVPGDLEEYLGLPKVESYRKVTEAIWHLEQNGIEKEKEDYLLKAL